MLIPRGGANLPQDRFQVILFGLQLFAICLELLGQLFAMVKRTAMHCQISEQALGFPGREFDMTIALPNPEMAQHADAQRWLFRSAMHQGFYSTLPPTSGCLVKRVLAGFA